MTDNITIQSNETEALINNLVNYQGVIESSMNNMENIMSNIKAAFEGEISEELQNKFLELSDKFPIIKENIQSYITDFKTLVADFDIQDKTVKTDEVTIASKEGEFINVKKD